MKARASRVMLRMWSHKLPLNPRDLGVQASTHCRACACWMCTEPGRNVPQPRERAFYDVDY